MLQSLSRILVHLIFSTKNQAPVLTPLICSELHPYLAVVLRDNNCPSLQVGGMDDHVHLFFGLSRSLSITDVVEIVKVSSSRWIKMKGDDFARFQWQSGYGAFSIGQSNADEVVRYIQNQEEHHRRMTFQEEFRRFLELYQIEYDERYVWD